MSNSENKWRLPHIIKIAEAYTAMADKRYKANSCTLEVFSSDFSKKYTVTIYNDGYASNDNMSYNFNILGYPIVIALMIEGKIPSVELTGQKLIRNLNGIFRLRWILLSKKYRMINMIQIQ